MLSFICVLIDSFHQRTDNLKAGFGWLIEGASYYYHHHHHDDDNDDDDDGLATLE